MATASVTKSHTVISNPHQYTQAIEVLRMGLELIGNDRGFGPFNPKSDTDQGCSCIRAVIKALEAAQ